MIAIPALVISFGLTAFAAPSPRSVDNGACQALQSTCAATVRADLSDAWNIKACIFGATCFGGQRPVDGFLAAMQSEKGSSSPVSASVNLPRLTSSLFKSISSDGKTLTEQNFVDGFYSSLDASNGPYPTSVSVVQGYYERVAVWTAFCSSAIPLQNFADYFQYSSSVNSNGCAISATSVAPIAVTSTGPITAASSAASGAVTFTSEAVGATTFTSIAPVTVTTNVVGAVTATSIAPVTAVTSAATGAFTATSEAIVAVTSSIESAGATTFTSVASITAVSSAATGAVAGTVTSTIVAPAAVTSSV